MFSQNNKQKENGCEKTVKYILVLSFLLLVLCVTVACAKSIGNYTMLSRMNNLHPVEIIYFDKKTAEKLGKFPIDRRYYADVLHEIEKSKPKAVILKFFFDRCTNSDESLKRALSLYNNVFTQTTSLISPDLPVDFRLARKYRLTHVNIQNYSNKNTILLPNTTLLSCFAGLGFVDMIMDNNEYINCPLVTMVNDDYYPSMALRLAMYITESSPEYKDDCFILKQRKIHAPGGNLKIDLSKPKSLYKTYSFIDVLNKKEKYNFGNKIVIVFVENRNVRNIKSKYNTLHSNAEIIADSINTLLKRLETR